MATILDELRKRKELLSQITALADREPIFGTLKWLESSVEIKPILDQLRRDIPIEPLLPSNTGFRGGPKISTPLESCRFGLYILEQCRMKNAGLYNMAYHLQVHSKYSDKTAAGTINAALERYIEPLLDHIESTLIEQGDQPSLETVVDAFRANIFSPEFSQKFAKTADALQKISSVFSDADADNPWYTAGVLCREALNTFSQELQASGYVSRSEELKAGDTKGTLKQAIVQKNGAGRFSDTLSGLTCAAWDHVASILHRTSTTRDEALRAYMWTGLVISEISRLLEKTATQ